MSKNNDNTVSREVVSVTALPVPNRIVLGLRDRQGDVAAVELDATGIEVLTAQLLEGIAASNAGAEYSKGFVREVHDVPSRLN